MPLLLRVTTAQRFRASLHSQLYVLEGELDSEEVDCMRVYRMKLGLRTHAWELVVPRTFSPPARRFSTVCETNKVSNCGLALKSKLTPDKEKHSKACLISVDLQRPHSRKCDILMSTGKMLSVFGPFVWSFLIRQIQLT